MSDVGFQKDTMSVCFVTEREFAGKKFPQTSGFWEMIWWTVAGRRVEYTYFCSPKGFSGFSFCSRSSTSYHVCCVHGFAYHSSE